MHDDHSHRCSAARVPVAVTKHLHPGFNCEEPFLGRWKKIPSRQEVAGDGLRVPIEEWPPRAKWLAKVVTSSRRSDGRRLIVPWLAEELIVGGDDRRLLYL